MTDILIMGEILVEIMRDHEDVPLDEAGIFKGPYPSGAPAICIDAAARLGCRTMLIGSVGQDVFGSCVLNRLERDGVDCTHISRSADSSTGCAFVTYFADGSRKFIFHMGAALEAEAPDISQLPEVKYMHIMGCSLMAGSQLSNEIRKTMQSLSARGTKISFDPNIRKELFTADTEDILNEVLQKTNIFLPGREELLMITKTATVEAAVKKCFENPALEILVLKDGSNGSRLFTRDTAIGNSSAAENNPTAENRPIAENRLIAESIPVYPVKQIDATGAGDCFDGAFLAGLCQGKTPAEAARMGAAAGALNVMAFGPMEGDISPENIGKMTSTKPPLR